MNSVVLNTLAFAVATLSAPAANGQTAQSIVSKAEGYRAVSDVMRRLIDKRDKHTAEVRSIADAEERQRRSQDFPPIDSELEELVRLEARYRAKSAGCLVITHLCTLSSSYGGTQRPVHRAMANVLPHLEQYGHLPDLALCFERMVALDDLRISDALTRLIDARSTLPAIRECARYCRARWKLGVVFERESLSSELQVSDPQRMKTIRGTLEKYYPSETAAMQWNKDAMRELGELSDSESGYRVPAAVLLDERGFIRAIDEEKTARNRTIAESAAGVLFRAKHLRPGCKAPELEVDLLSGEKWSLSAQPGKIVIVQFSFKGCLPCERMYPVLREFADNHPEQIAVLSVMADPAREDVRDAVANGKMSWPVTWDGANGPIASRWGVTTFPSVFIFSSGQRLISAGLPAEYLAEVLRGLMEAEQSNNGAQKN